MTRLLIWAVGLSLWLGIAAAGDFHPTVASLGAFGLGVGLAGAANDHISKKRTP